MTAAARRLRIALFTTFYPPHNFGGDGIYVRRLAHALVALGCEVSVIYDKDAYYALAPRGQKHPQPLDEPEGLTLHALESALGIISPLLTQQLGTPVIQRKRIEDILSQGFDIIHYHNVSLVGGPGLLSLGPDTLRVYTAHEHWLACPTHILWKNNEEVCAKKACLLCQIRYRKPPQLWRYTGLLGRHLGKIDAFIALSQSSADNHRRFGFKAPMRVMPSFLPDLEPDSKTAAAPHPRPYVIFAGRLERIKGLQDVIPAFGSDMPVDLLIAGSGEYESELRSLANNSPRIHFLGRLTPEALNNFYKHALALLAPSKCYEVFPLVALEAFRLGTPIIARNLGSYPEIVETSKAGFLFDTPEDLRQIVDRLHVAPALRQDLSYAALAAFQAHWSQSASLSAYFDLIAELADKRRNTEVSLAAAGLAARLRSAV